MCLQSGQGDASSTGDIIHSVFSSSSAKGNKIYSLTTVDLVSFACIHFREFLLSGLYED